MAARRQSRRPADAPPHRAGLPRPGDDRARDQSRAGSRTSGRSRRRHPRARAGALAGRLARRSRPGAGICAARAGPRPEGACRGRGGHAPAGTGRARGGAHRELRPIRWSFAVSPRTAHEWRRCSELTRAACEAVTELDGGDRAAHAAGGVRRRQPAIPGGPRVRVARMGDVRPLGRAARARRCAGINGR